MLGLYINFHSPFGKHFIGTSDTVEGICTLVKDMTGTDISTNVVEAAVRLTDSYYQELDGGAWFIIQETTHKYRTIRRVAIDNG
jgi:predicted TPR repeat methyltransferase